MRKRILIILFFAASLSAASAQQSTQYSLFMFNKMNWNPAFAGLDHSLSLSGGFRSQWTDLDGAPQTQYVYLHAPLYFLSSGVGLGLENDQIGAQTTTTIYGAYSYQLTLGDRKYLNFGAGAKFIQKSLDGTLLRTPDGIYENIIDHQDNILPNTLENASTVSFNAGIYYWSPTIEAGVSVDHLSAPTIDFTTFSPVINRTYTAYLGVNIQLLDNLSLHPSAFVVSDEIQTQPQLSAIFKYNENLFGGFGVRGYNQQTMDALTIIVGFKLGENITLGYAYDSTLSELNVIASQSHEIMINYNLNKSFGQGRPPNIIYNPRNL